MASRWSSSFSGVGTPCSRPSSAISIDTADNYGPSTKGGVVRTGDSAWHITGRPEQLRAMCEASLRLLRLDTIDLYQLHRLDPGVPMADQLGTLDALRTEGEIRHLGLDTVTAEQLEAALELTDIASVQNRYNLLDRASEPLLSRLDSLG
ncbi:MULTISPECIES: aldo/keto reductase [Streptomyces]|nr:MULTISPECIES: aldo/keto reductase [Streptomyces]GDY77970.1 hypothetical protein SAV31267_074550 [Streptomyces avermitilis]GDY86846.1 hypothetical protein SAVCW2_60450 [Streptomyces avermitilis]